MSRLEEAKALATRWHCGQFRKGRMREAYLHHPRRVVEILQSAGIDEEEILCTAWTHDLLEDTDCPPGEIRQVCGERVLRWVRSLSDDKQLLKSLRKQYQVERAVYLEPEAKRVRMADKIDNLESLQSDPPPDWRLPRLREYAAWSRRVFLQLQYTHPVLEARYQEAHAKLWAQLTGQESPED